MGLATPESRDLLEATPNRLTVPDSCLAASSGSAKVTVAGAPAPGVSEVGEVSHLGSSVVHGAVGQVSRVPPVGSVARDVRRRVGQQLDRRRPLQRRGALAGDDEELPTALGRMTLSDAEDGEDVNVAARVRRVLRRSESEVSLGHADAELASCMERVGVAGRTPFSPSSRTRRGAADELPLRDDDGQAQTEQVGRGEGAEPVVGRRRSARIAARAGSVDAGDRTVTRGSSVARALSLIHI